MLLRQILPGQISSTTFKIGWLGLCIIYYLIDTNYMVPIRSQYFSKEKYLLDTNLLLQVDQPVLPPVLVPKNYSGDIPTSLPELPSLDEPGELTYSTVPQLWSVCACRCVWSAREHKLSNDRVTSPGLHHR